MIPSLPSVYNVINLKNVSSTNQEAIKLAKLGEDSAPDGTIVLAEEQSQGRGRRGNIWHSPPGNLYLSLILRPEVSVQRSAELSFVAALAVYDALGNIGPPGHQVHCKWPNDILLNNKKVAGILLETESKLNKRSVDWLVLGLGINVLSFPTDSNSKATSLKFEGWTNNADEVLRAFAKSFLSWTNQWLNEGFHVIRRNWLWRSIGIGEIVTVNIGKHKLTGTFMDISEDGALVLNVNDEIINVSAGEVFFKEQ